MSSAPQKIFELTLAALQGMCAEGAHRKDSVIQVAFAAAKLGQETYEQYRKLLREFGDSPNDV